MSTDGTTWSSPRSTDNPAVQQQRALYKDAWIDLQRAAVVAPMNGYIAQRSVQLGQHILPGEHLMSVIPLQDVWLEANFKETELTRVRVGQPVKILIDTYPDMQCTGKVTSLAQSTGAEFAVLPPQNATGNWVKVVQRLPVRLRLIPRPDEPALDNGAFAVELEVVPERVSAEIAKRTSLILLSMGGGPSGDAQYLFSTDILGYTDGHVPRHSKQYRDFRPELDRLQLALPHHLRELLRGPLPHHPRDRDEHQQFGMDRKRRLSESKNARTPRGRHAHRTDRKSVV